MKMLLPIHLLTQDRNVLFREDYEESQAHVELTERLRKTLYYGRTPTSDRPSLPVTEIAVELFQDAAPRELGKVDVFVASSYSRRACMSPCSLMLGMIYIERLKHKNPEYLQQVSSSDLFLISMMVASKYLNDEGVEEEVFNDEWAVSGTLDVEDLNELERDFLAAIDWNLFVSVENFQSMLLNVEQRIAWQKSNDHGFHTYTDALVLSTNPDVYRALQDLLADMCKVVLVCSVAYVAGALAMVGSTASLLVIRQHAPAVIPVAPPSNVLPPLDLGLVAALSDATHDSLRSLGGAMLNDVDEPTNMDVVHNHRHHHHGFNHKTDAKRTRQNTCIPGFLTLTLIKDTLLQFVAAFHDRLYSDQTHNQSQIGDQQHVNRIPLVCRCGCCSDRMRNTCRNMTNGSAFVNSHRNTDGLESIHDRDANRLNGLHLGESWTSCGKWQCCCPEADYQGLDAAERVERVPLPLVDVAHGFSTMAQAVS